MEMRYCPACRAEYAPGSECCHDCDVDLVDVLIDDLPTDEPPPVGPLVTVAAFDTPLKASILASRLDAEGIECFIADAETIAAHGLLSAALGGVKVQVRGADAPRAAAIVRQQAPAFAAAEGAARCPKCESTEVSRERFSPLFVVFGLLLLGFPLLFTSRRLKCLKCFHRWP
jgi:putative signal transducing protein